MMQTRIGAALTAVLLLIALAAAPASALLTMPMPVPSERLTIGNLHFDHYGQGDPALIFVPGLSMGGWTWSSAVAAFSQSHAVYVATLAGFDGMPAMPPPYIPQADAAIQQLVAQAKLRKPILVGHSLGGHLALRLVEEHSDMFGGAIIVDATPYFPPLQAGQTLQQRADNISMLVDGIATAPDFIYEAQTRTMVSGMVTDNAQVDNVTQHSLLSDRTTLAGATGEMSNEDLRPGLSKIAVPVLVVAPVSPQAPYMNDALRALTPDQLTDTIRGYYAGQYAGTKQLSVQTILNSKDFIMLDQPDALDAAIKAFLDQLHG
jgi:pimeloyl-ACP methyl ester carboxylesterase